MTFYAEKGKEFVSVTRPIEGLVHAGPEAALGCWTGDDASIQTRPAAIRALMAEIDRPLYVVRGREGVGVTAEGECLLGREGVMGFPLLAIVPPLMPERLGDPGFLGDHGLHYAYVAGAMANGIGSESIVEEMARAGMLGFFGAAGLAVSRVEKAIDRIQGSVGDLPYGFNLIHSPNESETEGRVADLYIQRGVPVVEASAYLRLTLPIVKYRVHGIHRDSSGEVVAPNRVIAKVSRVEVATRFFAPPPEKELRALVELGDITPEQAEMAASVPMAQDITAEADSGGHTDHRPAIALLPTLIALRDRMQAEHGYATPLRVGLGGGISTPSSAAGAFAMGAAYILTGSVNQACVEAGTSDTVRQMLAEASQADVARAPAADMFEMGVTVQVLKRGTMFSMRGSKLYELYRAYDSIEAIPADERTKLETTVFRAPLDEIWRQTRLFFEERDPKQIAKAEANPRHKMALVFRWYLGQSSSWANAGVEDRKMDYQVWCGPAMGAFNEWVQGTFLEPFTERRVARVGRNLLFGAAIAARVNAIKQQGFSVPPQVERVEPATDSQVAPYFMIAAH